MANPTAAILSGAMMLRHLGEDAAADRITAAAHEFGNTPGGTVAVGDAIASAVA